MDGLLKCPERRNLFPNENCNAAKKIIKLSPSDGLFFLTFDILFFLSKTIIFTKKQNDFIQGPNTIKNFQLLFVKSSMKLSNASLQFYFVYIATVHISIILVSLIHFNRQMLINLFIPKLSAERILIIAKYQTNILIFISFHFIYYSAINLNNSKQTIENVKIVSTMCFLR